MRIRSLLSKILFIVVLIVLVLQGVLYIYSAIQSSLYRESIGVVEIAELVMGLAFLLSAIGIYRNAVWGYILALGCMAITIIGDIVVGEPVLAVLDTVITLIIAEMWLSRKHLVPSERPALPSPTAIVPTHTVFIHRKRFVRRRIE